ncbi:MAG: hypothetical protein JWR00_2895 [Rubritepida sp.]|nr:hypothetical protein [Rubritepida sp.]
MGQGNNRLGGGTPTNNQQANAALRNHWQYAPHTSQYDWDVAAWYGAYMSPGHASIQACLAKVFTVLQLAGVRYDNGTVSGNYRWRDCADQGIPLGAILAHGGRLLIQLPVRTANSNSGQDFFDWLTHEARAAGTCISRTTATHALSNRAPSTLIEGSRRFRIAEERGKTSGIRGAIKTKVFKEHNHWGVNLALFGAGRTNWVSGNTVDHLGGHGHLYIYFNPKDVGQCAGMMIGGENSGVGAMSQTFVGHGAKAVSEDFSPAGTYKWPAMDHGPNHMIEEFIVDLTDGWRHLIGLEAHFDPVQLDYTPAAASTAMLQTDLLRAVIYAVIDVLESPTGNLGMLAKRRLEGHKTTLLNSNNLPRATLSAILKECAEACGRKNVTISDTGAIGSSNPPTAVPQHIQTAIMTIQSNWGFSV